MNRKLILGIGIAVLLLVFAPIHSLWAQSSQSQLADLVAQLQNSPDDQELRKKIIKLVLTMSTKPEMPDEMAELMEKENPLLRTLKPLRISNLQLKP